MRWVMSPARRKTFMASDWRNPRNGGGFGGRERAGEARGTKGFGCGFGEEKVTWQRGGASVPVFFVHVYNSTTHEYCESLVYHFYFLRMLGSFLQFYFNILEEFSHFMLFDFNLIFIFSFVYFFLIKIFFIFNYE